MNRKLLFIGVPLSVISGIFLLLDVFYQEMPDRIVTLLMVSAVAGIIICYKAGAYK